MLARVEKWFLPVVAAAVAMFGIALFGWADYTRTVVNWNVAWGVFDLALAAVILATWWTARRGHWTALILVGALSAMQLVDVWFSLVVYYDVAERPGILGWAFVGQPVFALFTWRFVLRRVRRPGAVTRSAAAASDGPAGDGHDADTGVPVVTE
jgi:hypothetical protein